MTKELKAARAEVNKHEFGTAEWAWAMEAVRKLVDEQNAAQKFTHTSVDGDVWGV